MSNLTISEIKEAKENLQSEIESSIRKFIDKTGLVPVVNVNRISFAIGAMGSEESVVYNSEVKVSATLEL